MTGIADLIPIGVQDKSTIHLGSSLIAIQKDGYLIVHNDFNTFKGAL